MTKTSSDRTANSAYGRLFELQYLMNTSLVCGFGLISAAAKTPFWAVRERNFLSALHLIKTAARLASKKAAQVSLSLRPSGHFSIFYVKISMNRQSALRELFERRFST